MRGGIHHGHCPVRFPNDGLDYQTYLGRLAVFLDDGIRQAGRASIETHASDRPGFDLLCHVRKPDLVRIGLGPRRTPGNRYEPLKSGIRPDAIPLSRIL
jgi:hypothetical protein